MASLRKKTGGGRQCYELRFSVDRKTKSISLAGLNEAIALTWLTHVEHLIECKRLSTPYAAATLNWLSSLSDEHYEKLSAVGLIEPRAKQTEAKAVTLGEYLENFFAAKAGKESTRIFWQHTRKRLIEYFGAGRELRSITAMNARDFRKWLETSNKRDKPKERDDGTIEPPAKLAEGTIRRRIGVSREIFKQACEDGLLERNPFDGAGAVVVRSNKARQHYIDLETFSKVLKAAPNAKWRALLVLARIGTLRVPSEVAALRWCHIAWEAKRLTVLCSKTEHHAGKESRMVPLFPDIEKALRELWDDAPEGADRVFPDIDGSSNLRTTLEKIIRRAGIKQWPKLWVNLRSSACTDLARSLPAHVAAAIAGHSIKIAQEHYWQNLDDDLNRALAALPAVPVPTIVPIIGGNLGQNESRSKTPRESREQQKSL